MSEEARPEQVLQHQAQILHSSEASVEEQANAIRALLGSDGVADAVLLDAVRVIHDNELYDFLEDVWIRLRRTQDPATVERILNCEYHSSYWAETLGLINWHNPVLATLRPRALELLEYHMLSVDIDEETAEGATRALLQEEPLIVALRLVEIGGAGQATGSALRCVASEGGFDLIIVALAGGLFDIPRDRVISQDYLVQRVLDELELLYNPEMSLQLFTSLLEDPRPELRAFAAYALGLTPAAEALKVLLLHQGDPDERVSTAVTGAIEVLTHLLGA